jgi:hypothetical protein
MAVPTSYLTSTKNLAAILGAIQKASVPQKFTYEFLKQLGYASSSDRPVIPLLKAMRFIDQSGVPLDRYKRYRDTSQAGRVLAEGIREAYADVFGVDQEANNLSVQQLKGVFARLSNKGESVVDKMAITFNALASRADWTPIAETPSADDTEPAEEADQQREVEAPPPTGVLSPLRLHHDIHVHLPVSAEVDVYDAIFRALRQNFGA